MVAIRVDSCRVNAVIVSVETSLILFRLTLHFLSFLDWATGWMRRWWMWRITTSLPRIMYRSLNVKRKGSFVFALGAVKKV